MQLTTFSDLGLRILMLVGARKVANVADGATITISALAAELNASRNHVAKVVNDLGNRGVVGSVRGRHGGVHITDEGMRASVGGLLRQLEGEKDVVDCEGAMRCPLASLDCALRHRLAAAQEAFFATLDGDTIEDLVNATQPLIADVSGPVPLAAPTVRR